MVVWPLFVSTCQLMLQRWRDNAEPFHRGLRVRYSDRIFGVRYPCKGHEARLKRRWQFEVTSILTLRYGG